MSLISVCQQMQIISLNKVIFYCEIGNEILNTVLGFVRGTALPVCGYGRNSCRLVLHSAVTR